jgi:hypothetical protein
MDFVKVVNVEEVYLSYSSWVEKFTPIYTKNFIKGSVPKVENLFRVVFTAPHLKTNEIIHLIEDIELKQVYVIHSSGVRTANRNEIM